MSNYVKLREKSFITFKMSVKLNPDTFAFTLTR